MGALDSSASFTRPRSSLRKSGSARSCALSASRADWRVWEGVGVGEGEGEGMVVGCQCAMGPGVGKGVWWWRSHEHHMLRGPYVSCRDVHS